MLANRRYNVFHADTEVGDASDHIDSHGYSKSLMRPGCEVAGVEEATLGVAPWRRVTTRVSALGLLPMAVENRSRPPPPLVTLLDMADLTGLTVLSGHTTGPTTLAPAVDLTCSTRRYGGL